MTLTPYEPTNRVAPAADQSSQGAARIVQWAESAEAAHRLANALCRTSFCPEQFRNKPDEATGAILAGGEVGLSPMASLNAFDIIQGRAAPRAKTLLAIVQSFGHDVELMESSERRCRMRGRRKGADKWQEVTWTIDRATKLKLTGKQPWQTQPTAMLVARATSEICRLVAADAILGIGYAAEELEDTFGPDTPEARRKVQRRTPAALAALAPSPEHDDELLGDGQETVADGTDKTDEVQPGPDDVPLPGAEEWPTPAEVKP